MTPDEKLKVLETYGKVTIDSRGVPFSETGMLYRYNIAVESTNGVDFPSGSFLRTGNTRDDSIERMYSYISAYMFEMAVYL